MQGFLYCLSTVGGGLTSEGEKRFKLTKTCRLSMCKDHFRKQTCIKECMAKNCISTSLLLTPKKPDLIILIYKKATNFSTFIPVTYFCS